MKATPSRLVLCVSVLALASLPAPAVEAVSAEGCIEEIWHVDALSAAQSLPLVKDYNGDGELEILFTTRFDGRVWVINHDGTLLRKLAGQHPLEGSMAAHADSAFFAYEDSRGRLVLSDFARGINLWAEFEGEPKAGGAPCYADLDADGLPELVCARGDGIISVFDHELAPCWQFDAGSVLAAPPTVAPVFENAAAIYVRAGDGMLHALSGEGRPLWQFRTGERAPGDSPLVVQMGTGRASVLITDKRGTLYALDAADGRVQWQVRIGSSDLGTPAIADVWPKDGREIIVVSQEGDIGVVDGQGVILHRASLPGAEYLARPLVADVDGDGQPEILVANSTWGITVASLEGNVKTTLELRGNVLEGIVLEDLDGDGSLELLAATDCARLHCFSTRAKEGWKHPRSNMALNGCAAPIRPVQVPPPARKTHRRLRVVSVDAAGSSKKPDLETAFVRVKKPRGTHYVSAVIRCEGTIVGSAFKSFDADGFTVPFVRPSAEGVLNLDVTVLDSQRRPLASIAGAPFRQDKVRLVKLTSPDAFASALAECAACFSVPKDWHLPSARGQTSWFVTSGAPETWETYGIANEPFIAESIPCVWSPPEGEQPYSDCGNPVWTELLDIAAVPPVEHAVLAGEMPDIPLSLAELRGAARQHRGKPWGVSICNRLHGAIADTRYRGGLPRIKWIPPGQAEGPDCGHSDSLEFRLEMAAHLAGASFVRHDSDVRNGTIFVQEDEQGQYALSPFGAAVKTWYEYTRRYPERGVPYTPVAFLTSCGARGEGAVTAMLAHAYGSRSGRLGFERDYLTNGPYGDIFDVITEDAAVDVLKNYGVVWPVGQGALRAAYREALMEYTEQGGVLVMDAQLATAFPRDFLGVRFSRHTSAATQAQTALANVPRVLAPYEHQRMTVHRSAQTLAWTESGQPLLAWRRYAKGIVIVSATRHWLDERGHVVPLVPAILQAVANAFLPIRPPAGVETFYNRTDDGWIIGLINNNGVTKRPTEPAVTDPKETRDCVLRFPEQAPLRFLPRIGRFRWNNFANGLHTRLKPGEVAVLKLVLPPPQEK